jgi:hypothetical protein
LTQVASRSYVVLTAPSDRPCELSQVKLMVTWAPPQRARKLPNLTAVTLTSARLRGEVTANVGSTISASYCLRFPVSVDAVDARSIVDM